jgi:16S rRNA (cytosine967-C5)-methyltransferase
MRCGLLPQGLDRIAGNAARLGVEIVQIVPPDQLEGVLGEHEPDVILVDVPCSNSGVFGRRPEAKYRQSVRSLASLKKEQMGLLRRAMEIGGESGSRIVYSTCSEEPEENEQVIQEVLTGQGEWVVTDARLYPPTYNGEITSWRDGGYVAVMEAAVRGGR